MADIKVSTWQMKAKFGDAAAMNKLGLAYREGSGVEKDLSESVNWFYKAATAGNLDATFNMAIAFYQGLGVKVDLKEGIKWMSLAAELGHEDAMVDMHVKHYNGQIVDKDLNKSFYWLEKSAESGNVHSMRYMAFAYYKKNFMENIEVDVVKATAWFQRAAEAGDAESMYYLGNAYLNGNGTEQDVNKAAEWYKKGANAGVSSAMNCLGALYLFGQGVEKDSDKAIQWFKKGADAGDRDAMHSLGQVYADGWGVKQDWAKAMDWYAKAAAAGNSSAMNILGKAYANGNGVTRDMVKAADWFKKAAESGNVEAMYRLGCVYQEGIGTDRNLKEANKWFNKAAQDNRKAPYTLLAKNKLSKGRDVSIAREVLKLLQMAEDKSVYEDYDELLSEAQKTIAYEESFMQIMHEKFGIELSTDSPKQTSAMDELDQMIGLQKVKEEVRNLKALVEVQQKMKELGKEPQKISLHMVFTGNPGTGKTTVARIIAKVFHEIGIIPTDKLVECDRATLVGQHVGHTAPKTQAVIDSALGGVLFIDEAYALCPKDSSRDFGQEAINTLLKAMEDNRDNLIVIVAGYTKEMKDFIDTNPGLQSRFSLFMDFEDYTVAEMVQIFKYTCDSRGYVVSDDSWETVIKEMTKMINSKNENFANGRDVRNFFEKVLKKQNVRISRLGINGLTEMDFMTIMKEDIADETEEENEDESGVEQTSQKSALEELDGMIGLDSVKIEVLNLKKKIIAQKKLREMGRNVENASMHMVFTGNPGTGKTTVARIIAQVFHEIGVIPTDKLVECDRASLVGQYIGETAPKTQAVIDSALGGVLFIDEAYTLSPQDSPRDFGREAINTILKAMEDNRDNLIVIVAGYKKEMQDFLASNPGLESRFKYFIDFPDYIPDEMFEIFRSYCVKEQYEISEEAVPYLKEHFARMDAGKGEKFGNGRDVRNYYERVVQRVLVRFTEIGEDATEDDLVIRAEDVIEN